MQARRLGVLPLLVALLGASACLGPMAELFPPRPGEPVVTVYVTGHGWHTGIVIAREDIPSAAWPEHAHFPPARYLEVGWGDRAFYQAVEPGIGLALKAAFASGGSVLHVAGLDRPPAEYFRRAAVIAIGVSPRGIEALARFISRAYSRDAAGQPTLLGPGLYPLSRFYAAEGRYHLLYTCNNWVAEALRAAGCPVTPFYAVTAGNLLLQAASCGRLIREAD
jgi:uncharacterized protein (TIGR02117 family)